MSDDPVVWILSSMRDEFQREARKSRKLAREELKRRARGIIASTRWVTGAGCTLSLSGWARRLRIARSTLRWRLGAGWTIEQMLAGRTGGVRVSHCPHGHDVAQVGRDRYGHCKGCAADFRRRQKEARC